VAARERLLIDDTALTRIGAAQSPKNTSLIVSRVIVIPAEAT
jgi:hypothetical protein